MTVTDAADLPLIRLFEGDSLDVLATIPEHTYTCFVTDPPYGLSAPKNPYDVLAQWLDGGDFVSTGGRKKAPPPGKSELAPRFNKATGGGFLGAAWDHFVPGPRLWSEVFRVCKPGAIGVVFSATRTQHWMTLSLALAGFEIIEVLGYVTSMGMPKAGTIDKRIDKRRHDRDVVLRCTAWIRGRCEELGLTPRDLDEACGTNGMGSHWTSAKSQPYVPTRQQWEKLEPLLGPVPEWMAVQHCIIDARAPGEDWAKRVVLGVHPNPASNRDDNAAPVGPVARDEDVLLTAPATDTSAVWAGWSTTLAPALEPIIVVRRPCEGTATANVLKWGCGAMNIDACRVGAESTRRSNVVDMGYAGGLVAAGKGYETGSESGRWPKTLLLDEDTAATLDDVVGERKSGSRAAGAYGQRQKGDGRLYGECAPREQKEIVGSTGGPSRFFPVLSNDRGRWPETLDSMHPKTKDGVAVKRNTAGIPQGMFGIKSNGEDAGYCGEGGPSRFFPVVDDDRDGLWDWDWVGPLATAEDMRLPIKYTCKVSKKERQMGVPDGVKCDHPTLKGCEKRDSIMRWLCRLVGHPKGRGLDPFAGSGSTLRAARHEGLPFDGIERDPHYARDLALPRSGAGHLTPWRPEDVAAEAAASVSAQVDAAVERAPDFLAQLQGDLGISRAEVEKLADTIRELDAEMKQPCASPDACVDCGAVESEDGPLVFGSLCGPCQAKRVAASPEWSEPRIRTAQELVDADLEDRCCMLVARGVCEQMTDDETLDVIRALRGRTNVEGGQDDLGFGLVDATPGPTEVRFACPSDGSAAVVQIVRTPHVHVGDVGLLCPLSRTTVDVRVDRSGRAAQVADAAVEWPELVVLLLRRGDVLDVAPERCEHTATS